VAGIALCLVWGLLLLWTPESPAYLLTQKDFDGARRAMVFLRGHSYIETELAEVQRSIEEAGPEMKNDIKSSEGQNFDIISQLYHPLKNDIKISLSSKK
jgi:hypothetical protein